MNWSDRVIHCPNAAGPRQRADARRRGYPLFRVQACPSPAGAQDGGGLLRAFAWRSRDGASSSSAPGRSGARLPASPAPEPRRPLRSGPGQGRLELAANAPVGLLYAARTLAQWCALPRLGRRARWSYPWSRWGLARRGGARGVGRRLQATWPGPRWTEPLEAMSAPGGRGPPGA